MAKKSKTDESSESALTSAAKLVGTAVGKVASAVGITGEGVHSKRKPKPGKLRSKNKSRLPRRQKKAQRKAPPAR